MKTLFILFTLLFSLSSMAAIVGNQNCATCITVAGRVLDLSNPNIKKLTASHNTIGYDTFTGIDGSTYQVPSSTQAVYLAYSGHISQSTTASFSIMYNDVSEVRDNLNSAPTTQIYHTGTVNGLSGRYLYIEGVAAGTSNKNNEGIIHFAAPTGKVITNFVDTTLSATITLYVGECPDTGTCEFE